MQIQLTHNIFFHLYRGKQSQSGKFSSNTFNNKSINIKQISKTVKTVKYYTKFQAVKLAHLIPHSGWAII